MKIEYIVEHEDGGATVKFDLEPEEIQGILVYAIKDILTKAAQEVVDE